MEKCLYFLFPGKTSLKQPSIVVDSAVVQIFEIKSEKNWQSQIDSSYNNLYLIQIKNISHETQTNFKIKLTYDNVEYESQKLMNITDYFESNSQKPESIAFLFKLKFKSPDKNLYYPKERKVISLSEEIAYMQLYFNQKNEWNEKILSCLLNDILLFWLKHLEKHQKIEFEVLLFLIQNSFINHPYILKNLPELEKTIEDIELTHQFNIPEVNDVKQISNMFYNILKERKYEIVDNQEDNQSIPLKMREKIMQYFLLYLLKYNQNELIQFIEQFNEQLTNSNELFRILINENLFILFKGIGLKNFNLQHLIKYCKDGNDFKRLCLFIKKIKSCIKIFTYENNIQIISEIDKTLTNNVVLQIQEILKDINDLHNYTKSCEEFKNLNFNHIILSNLFISSSIESIKNISILLNFITNNVDLIEKLQIKITMEKNDNVIHVNQFPLVELSEIMKNANKLFELQSQKKLTKISLNSNLIEDIIKNSLFNIPRSEIISFIKDFSTNYPLIYQSLQKSLSEVLHKTIIEVIKQEEIINNDLLELVLLEKLDNVNYQEYTKEFCQLISFQEINDSFIKNYHKVVEKFFKGKNDILKIFYTKLISLSVKTTFNELSNLLKIIKSDVHNNPTLMEHIFKIAKDKFFSLISKQEDKDIHYISLCFQQLFDFVVPKQDPEPTIIKIIEHLKTYFNDNEINSILNSIQKLTESGNKKIKKLIIEKFLPKLSELSHKNLEKLFLEYKNNPELLELIFEKEKDLVINEKDFLTQNSKFTFFTLVVKNHIFDFKDGFQKFKKLKYFQETLKQVTNIQKFLSEKLFTFSDTKLMHIMIENYVFDNNLVYLHLNSQPPENFVNSLRSTIIQFVAYEKAIYNVNAFNKFVYQDKIEQNKEIEDLISLINKKNIKNLLQVQSKFDNIQKKNSEIEKYTQLFQSKFFNIIYKQLVSDNEVNKIQEAKEIFESLKNLLDINLYKNVKPELINDLIYNCTEEEINQEFSFLETYFKIVNKNNVEEVKQIFIIGINKVNTLKFVESTLMICKEYDVKETKFIENYKKIRNTLFKDNISIENLQEIEKSLNEDLLHQNDQEQQCKYLLSVIHNKEYFFEFVRDKTRESIHQLNDYIGDLDDQQLYPGDIPILENVVYFCEKLQKNKGKQDTIFFRLFRDLVCQEKIAESFQIAIQKFYSFKDLTDKLKNKEEFTIEKIEQILNYSIFSIKCSLSQENNVICKIQYNEKQNREISLKDILELRNKARLQNRKMNNDKNKENSLLFIDIIHKINQLLNVINQLVIKGDIKMHQYLIKLINKQITILNNDGKENNTSLDDIIKNCHTRLENIITIQRQMYQKENNTELTYLYGKNIFQLSQFIRSKGKDARTEIEHFFNYFTDNKLDISKIKQIDEINTNALNNEDIQEFIENCLANFLKNILKKNNISIDEIFTNSLIKRELEANPGIYTSYFDPNFEVEENLIKIYIYYTNNLPKPQTLLFCNQNTTIEEITAFIYRALFYPKKVMFGIAQIELLSLSIREEILKILETESKKLVGIKALLILFYKDQKLDLINQVSQKKIATIFSKAKLNETNINQYELFNIQLVSANASGVGKSFYIKSRAKNNMQNYLYFPIGGDFTRKDIIERLQKIKKQTKKTLLHLDLHETKKISLMKDFLFSFIVFRSYSYGHLFFYLDTQIEIMVEIPYGYFDYLHQYPILRLTCLEIKVAREKLEYQISLDLLSDEQIVCNILNLFEKDKINTNVIQHKKLNHFPVTLQKFPKFLIDKPLQQNICNELLKKVYDKTGLSNPTFYQQKILISILAIQFKHFLQSLYLDPNLLDKNGKKKNNPNLYLIRAKIIDCFIQLTKHFTKGAYHEFLQKDSIYKSKKLQYEGNKATEKGLKDLSNKQKVSFKNINPSLLLFNQDGQSLSVVTTIKKNTKNKKELEEYQMFRDLINSSSFNNEKDLNDYERINDNKCFLEELVKILNIKKSTFDPEELKKKNLEFSTNSSKKVEFLEKYLDSFVFTADNFAKLILILLRIRARIPVILMGETGCGKTFLVRTMSKLYGSNLKILNIHAGITENDIISFLEKESLFQDSKNEKDKRQIWVFLDEINTCNAMGLISEIMIKNSAQGRLLNSNLIFIGACNPYREPLKQSNIYGLTIFNQPQGLKLVYTVNLLPHSLLNYVMDFGHLEPEDELKYIESMVTKPIKKLCIKYNLIEEISLKYQQQTIHAIQKCQNFLKENNDVSVVSLRELKRFVIFFEWFVDYLLIKSKDDRYKNNKNSTYFQLFYKNNSQPNYYLIIKLSINLAVYVCYYLRLPNSEKRNELNKLLSEILKEQSFIKFPLEDSMDIAKRVDIPKGTALNSAFLDNLYCSFVCINAKVPLIICGKPGCSKSFTIKILFNSLQGKFSNDYLFKKLPRVYITSYQGSKTNTSESVLFAFNKARDIIKKYQGNMINQIISLLFFDEIGLAEKSENNPLKVIHSQLEYEDNEYKIAFIGISNWTLDASKMNRCVFLSINEPNENTLINTALSIAESFKDGLSKEPNNLKILTNLAKTFYQYKYDPFSDKEFFDFHGLRDFYHLIKCVCHNLIKSSNTRNIEIFSIEKNLAGRGPSLLNAKEKYAEINNNNIKLISQNYNVLEIIKQNIINEEQNLTNLCNTQVNQTSNVYEQRFLLIFKESQNIHIIMESLMKELKKEYIFYIGSQFKKDKFSQEYNVKILSKIKQSCEEGKIIFLSDLDYLYPSYYDVFNQNYTIRDGKKYAKVIVETNESVQAYINDKTRFVLLFDTNRLNNYNTLPEIPLLNRFEKHILSYNDLIPPPTKEYFDKINQLLERMKIFESKINANEIILDPKDLFINCSAEEIQSILFEITKENEFQVDNKVFQKLSNLFPQDLLAILNILDISNNKPFINLIYKFCKKRLDLNSSLPKYLENTSYKKSIIYTFTPIIKNLDSLSCESEFDNKEKQNISTNTIHYITVNSISTEAEIEKILFNFYTNPIKNICFIKFSLSDIIHLQSIKNLIDNFEIENEYLIPNIKYKKIILIIYIQKYLTDEKYPENYKETVNKMKGKLIPHIVPDYDQIIIDNLFPQNEELNVNFFKYLNKNNKELIQLVDSETIFINEFNYCLEFIKYIECGQFPDKEIQNLTQYKQKLQNVITNNEDFKSLIKKLIVEMADKSESFIHSVFYKKNKAFTIYYISFLEVFHNYLKGQFIDLFIKVLCLLEIEVNCYSIIMNENCQNKKLKEFNQSQLKTFKSDNINNMYNEIFFHPGTKVFQSFKKIKSIQNALFSTIKAFIFYQNQIRNGKMKGDEDINDYNNIQEQIEKKLIAYFSKEYEDFQEEILYDYIKFYLCSNNLLETNFFEQLISFLIQQKFGSKDNIKLCDKIFWLEVNKDYVVQICLMYREFIDESKSNIPFFDDVKQTAIQIKEHNSEILEVNEGLFEISEALLEVLYKQNKINENINKLKVVCHSMKLLNEILKFNSEYLYKWEIIIESHEFFPDEEENIKFQKVIEEDNLDNFLQFIEDHYKKLENYDEFMINILQAECQRINDDNDENLRIIVNHIFKDFALVRKSKTILYLILYNTNENFELTSLIQSNEDEENDTKHNVFEKVANNVAVKKLFMYLEEQKDDKDYNKKYFIIENHFLFIFEIIAYDFFETLIKLSVKQSTGQEKKEKEASVISITEDNNNITFKLLEKAIIIIKESVNKEKEISKISFLYAISYIKIYLEFFIQFYNTHLEELGDHSDIIKEILNFGGESHTNLKKAIFYYILKLFDKNLNGFTKITERNWETWGENYDNFIEAYFENYLEYPRELDFPFFSNVENYNELQRKMNDSNIENNKENSREFINFIFNEYFSILTKTCHGNEYTHLQTIQTCFFNEDDNIWVCLNLLLLNDSNKEELVKNIEHLTQCDYVKLLHCFYFIVLILNEKGVDTLKSLYKELYNTFSNNKPIHFDLYENIKLVFYFSFEFFKEYLPFIKLQENKNSTSDSPRNLLNKLIEYLREIETIIDSPIEIFFHLFYKNYIESFDIRKAFHETIKNLPQFTKTYQQDCQKLFKIEENDLKSIIREMINPLDYKDNEYLKYFLLSNTFTLEKRKENFMNLEMKDMFPLLFYLYSIEEDTTILQLKQLHNLNYFGREIFEYYTTNKLSKKLAESTEIENFLNSDNEKQYKRTEYFKKFQDSWDNFHTLSEINTKITQQERPPNIENNSNILYCLPEKNEGKNGYHLTKIFRQCMYTQNEFIDKIIKYLRTTYPNKKFDYLVNQLSQNINIQDAFDNDIINLDIPLNRFHFRNILDMLKFYSERKYFDNDGNFILKSCRNIYVDNKKLHEELIKFFLQGKHKFSETIKYVSFLSDEKDLKIQEDLNKQKENQNKSFINKMF